MRPTATDVAHSVAHVSAFGLDTLVSCANDWTDRDAVWGLTYVGPRKHILGSNRTDPFAAARGDNMAMRPFSKQLWTFVFVHTGCIALRCGAVRAAQYNTSSANERLCHVPNSRQAFYGHADERVFMCRSLLLR